MYNKKSSGLRVDPQGMPTIKGSRGVRSTKDTKKGVVPTVGGEQ